MNTSTNTVYGTDSQNMEINAANAVMPEANICGSDCEIAWRNVSVSFV